MEKKGIDWLVLPYNYAQDEEGNILALPWHPRIIKRDTGEWIGRVHEAYSQKRAVVVDKTDEIGIRHTVTPEHSISSSHRNLRMLLSEYEEKGADFGASSTSRVYRQASA